MKQEKIQEIRLLIRDHLVEKMREEKGAMKALFRKTNTIIL